MKALVVSDQPLTVIALQSMLRHARPDAELFDATHMREALQTLSEEGPFDLILFDLDTLSTRRVSGAALLRKMWPAVPLVLVSEQHNEQDVARGLEIGAAAHLLMSNSTEALWTAMAQLVAVPTPWAEPAY